MYYLYHIPGKKIGVTRNLNTRVTLIQGYKKDEYEVLESSEDIDYISEKEIEYQKSFGYKVDRQKYNKLIKLNKMKINVTEQTSTFPCSLEELPNELESVKDSLKWTTSHGEFAITDKTIKWIIANAKTSMYNNNRSYIYNKAYYEAFLNKLHTPKNGNKFDKIRAWAQARGLYEKGDAETQFVKLMEETGELAKALLKGNQPEVVDAIGDIVVVLTNLAHMRHVTIEMCIDEAYSEIQNRTGKMINGTFVKDEN